MADAYWWIGHSHRLSALFRFIFLTNLFPLGSRGGCPSGRRQGTRLVESPLQGPAVRPASRAKPKRTLIIKSLLWPSVGSVLVVHMCLVYLTGEFQSPWERVGCFFRPSYKKIWQAFAPSCNTVMFKRVYDLMKLLVSVLPRVYTRLFNSYHAVRPRWRQHL